LKKLSYSQNTNTSKMENVSSHVFKNFGVTSQFYPSETDFIRVRSRDSLRKAISLDREFDSYSDASIDTSSSFSFDSSEYWNYAIQAKKNRYFCAESVGESLMQCGRGTRTHSESPQSSRWSEDDMSDFLPFDEMIRLTPSMTVEEEEERKYLEDLVHQDIVATEYGWCYPKIVDDAHLDFRRVHHNIPIDLIPTTTSVWNNLDDTVTVTDGVHNEAGLISLYRDHTVVGKNPNSNLILPNPNSRNNNSKLNAQEHVNTKVRSTETRSTEKVCTTNLTSKKKTKSKDEKSTDNDAQKVFLGGLPIGITERMLRQHLAAVGYKVLKRPKILHGFAPEVWMKNVEQAKDLIEKGVITIEGMEVEVRPYNSLTKLSELKKLPNVGKRSVFIGGLPAGTTTKDLQDVLVEMGMKVINYPVIKHGFARQVILDTISQARSLIKMKKIQINGVYGDVRPFVHQKRWRRTK